MKIKIIEAIHFNNFFQKILHRELPLLLCYKLTKIKDSLMNDVDFFYKEYQKILEKYLEKDSDGNFIKNNDNSFKIKEGSHFYLQSELEELEKIMIEIPRVQISFEELKGISFLSLEDMEILLPFIKEEE